MREAWRVPPRSIRHPHCRAERDVFRKLPNKNSDAWSVQATTIIFIGAHMSIPGKQMNQETGEQEEKPALEQVLLPLCVRTPPLLRWHRGDFLFFVVHTSVVRGNPCWWFGLEDSLAPACYEFAAV